MSKFKAGDEVEAISESFGWGKVVKGDVGQVASAGIDGELIVDFPAQKCWACRECDLELAEPKIMIHSVSYGGVPVAIYPNPPRKHKDAIIAWANGADIEIQDKIGEWHDIKDPTWYERGAYRIKPTKTPLQLKIEKCEAKLAKLKGQL